MLRIEILTPVLMELHIMGRSISNRLLALTLLVLTVFQSIHAYNQDFVSDFLTVLNVVSTVILTIGLCAFMLSLWDSSWALVPVARLLTLSAMVLNVVLTDTSSGSTALAHVAAYVVVAVLMLVLPSLPRTRRKD